MFVLLVLCLAFLLSSMALWNGVNLWIVVYRRSQEAGGMSVDYPVMGLALFLTVLGLLFGIVATLAFLSLG